MSTESGPALVEKINKVLPITPSACWSLHGLESSHSIWQCHDPDLVADGSVHACCSIVRSPVETVLQTLVDHNQRINWDCSVSSVKTVAMSTGPCVTQHDSRNDVVAVTPKVWPRWSLLRSADANISMARWWQCQKDHKWAWMLWRSLDDNDMDIRWSYALVSTYPEKGHCTIVMVVGSSDTSIAQPVPAQQMLAGLSQYLTILNISQHIAIPSSEFHLEKSSTDEEDDVTDSSSLQRHDSASSSANQSLASGSAAMSPTGLALYLQQDSYKEGKQQTDAESFDSLDSSKFADQQQKFSGVLNAAFDSIQESMAEGAEAGWEPIVTRTGVDVMKKTVSISVSCIRCSMPIDAPARVVLECFEDSAKQMIWDEMLCASRTVEYFSETMWVEHWTHKPVWPATSRDFCVVAGHVKQDDGSFISAARSVVHPACPAQPDHIRATVFECGAIIRPMGADEDQCQLSYITHFDFKGNVSAVVAHRITQSIPSCILSLKRLSAEAHRQLTEDQRKRRQSDAELAAAALMSPTSRQSPAMGSSHASRSNGLYDNANGSAPSNRDVETPSDMSVLSNATLEYPMMDQSRVDYRTLGNQAAAGLLGELILASDIDVYQPRKAMSSGGWQFDGIEKDVVILRKELPAVGHTLFMGKGIIPLPVSKVWAAVHEPHTRFGYDAMLKEMKTVATYGDRLLIMYMLLEAKQCFLSQARDFCFLHRERIEGTKHIVAAQTVDHPLCPPRTGVQRGVIVSSGWCVEAAEQDGQRHSMVTYVGRIDLKGNVPQRLTNYICRRQTLAIHALSKYLMSLS